MSLLEGFKPFNFDEGMPYMSATSNGVTFNKSVVAKLGFPSHVLLLINDKSKQIAIQVCTEETPNAAAFFKEKRSGVISVRWNGKDLLSTLQHLMSWNLKENGYRIDGTHLKEENAILFDLTQATELR